MTSMAVYCSCGAEWHGRWVQEAAYMIEIHVARETCAPVRRRCNCKECVPAKKKVQP